MERTNVSFEMSDEIPDHFHRGRRLPRAKTETSIPRSQNSDWRSSQVPTYDDRSSFSSYSERQERRFGIFRKSAKVRQIALTRAVNASLASRMLPNSGSLIISAPNRLFVSIEKAHWHYLDSERQMIPVLPELSFKAFVEISFKSNPTLQRYESRAIHLYRAFESYKKGLATCGAAILNERMDKVLLVRGGGSMKTYGFPKGKVEEGETRAQAAIREVYEETGYRITEISGSTPHIDVNDGRVVQIYIISGVPENTKFQTRTNGEITDMKWIALEDLPVSRFHRRKAYDVSLFTTGEEVRKKHSKIHFSGYMGSLIVQLIDWVKENS